MLCTQLMATGYRSQSGDAPLVNGTSKFEQFFKCLWRLMVVARRRGGAFELVWLSQVNYLSHSWVRLGFGCIDSRCRFLFLWRWISFLFEIYMCPTWPPPSHPPHCPSHSTSCARLELQLLHSLLIIMLYVVVLWVAVVVSEIPQNQWNAWLNASFPTQRVRTVWKWLNIAWKIVKRAARTNLCSLETKSNCNRLCVP